MANAAILHVVILENGCVKDESDYLLIEGIKDNIIFFNVSEEHIYFNNILQLRCDYKEFLKIVNGSYS